MSWLFWAGQNTLTRLVRGTNRCLLNLKNKILSVRRAHVTQRKVCPSLLKLFVKFHVSQSQPSKKTADCGFIVTIHIIIMSVVYVYSPHFLIIPYLLDLPTILFYFPFSPVSDAKQPLLLYYCFINIQPLLYMIYSALYLLFMFFFTEPNFGRKQKLTEIHQALIRWQIH